MQHVAFLRNVNQGQRAHPTTASLLEAFAAAGAANASAFQSNGTIVFEAADALDAASVVGEAHDWLASRSIFDGAVFSASLAFIASVVDRHADAAHMRRRELTLFSAQRGIDDPIAAAPIAAHRRCVILEHGRGWAVLANERDRESNGTPAIEAILHSPASSRGPPSLVRLVDRHAR